MRFGSRAVFPNSSGLFRNIVSFDPVTKDFEADGTYPEIPNLTYFNAYGLSDAAIFKDPATENVYIWSSASFARSNQAENTWTTIADFMLTEAWGVAAVDTRRNRAFYVGPIGSDLSPPVTIDLATNAFTNQTLSGIDIVALQTNGWAMVYQQMADAADDCFLMRDGTAGGTVYRINASTFVVDTLPSTGGSSIPESDSHSSVNIYTKFLSVPQYGGIVYFPRYAGNAWFLRTR